MGKRRLREVLPLAFQEAQAKMLADYERFLAVFEQETNEIVENTTPGSNISCPECSQETHRKSFKFHRKDSCVAKNPKLSLESGYEVRDYF